MLIAGREVQITNPDKVFFPVAGYTKGDLLDYYLAVAEGAVRAVSNRPMALKRFVQGADGEAFFQKRAPANRPEWIETAVLSFPSGRTAEEIVVRDAVQLAWVVNLGCIDLNPHPVRSDDLDHPDELRIDLDPMPGVPWSQVREVALAAKGVLDDMGLTGWPKTSGSRGMHIYCRIERGWTYPEVRRAAVAFAREVERRGRAKPYWSLPRARRRPGCRTRPGLRTTRCSQGRRPGSNPHGPAAALVPSPRRLPARMRARPAAAGRSCPWSRSPAPGRKRRRGKGSNAGRRATQRWSPTSNPPTCWSTRCAAAARHGIESGST